MKLTRTTISIREDILVAGQAKADRDYDRSFTAYIERLIREDLERAGMPLLAFAQTPRRKRGPKPSSKTASGAAKALEASASDYQPRRKRSS